MAAASWYGLEYLASWNCKHIAAGWVRRLVKEVNERLGIVTPEICTPLELMERSS